MLGSQALMRFGVGVPMSDAPSARGGWLLVAKGTMQRRQPGMTAPELGAGGQTMRSTWYKVQTVMEK